MDRRAVVAVGLVTLVLAGVGVDGFLDDIARDNLSNDDFERLHKWTPEEFGLPVQHVTFNSQGLSLVGWWIPGHGENASTSVILIHGYGSTMARVLRSWAPDLHDAGYSILTFDLRNHGASPDTHTGYVTYGVDEAQDVLAAIDFLRTETETFQIDPDRIVLFGGSMGAATALNVAGQHPPGVIGVIADSSYASFVFEARIDGEAKGYPAFVVNWVVSKMNRFAPSPPSDSRPEQALATLQMPVLLAHCTDDESITFPNFERLQAQAPAGTVTWLDECPTGISDQHHVDGWMHASYNATVRSFLASLRS